MLAAPIAAAQNGRQINLDPVSGLNIIGDAANEPSLAVSPVDPDVMVVGWRQFPTINSDSRFAGFAYSHDGGLSWTNGGTLDHPPNQPANAEQSDPVLAVNSQGVFFYWSEVFRPNPPTAHYVYRSLDGGMTWTIPTQVQNPPTPGDKEWITIDRTAGIGNGHIYGGWNNFDLNGQCFVRSIDGGNSYSEPVRIADAGGTQWMLHLAVGPDGELYAAWRNFRENAIFITKSTNAQNPAVVPTFDAFGPGGRNGIDIRLDDGNNPIYLVLNPVGFHQIYLDVDRSTGPRRGWVYCLWADDRNDVCDILFARSRDGGFNWDTGFRVNDDALGNGAYQWMPAMSVAPDGRIDAVWYDTRNDLSRPVPSSELFYSFSTDGGATWSENRRLSDPFDTTLGWPQQNKIGDYIQSVSDDAGVNLVYAATFNGEQDIYFLRINPNPCPADLNGDGVIDLADLGILLADFGCVPPGPCVADINGDGNTDLADLGILLSEFGTTCP